MANAYSTLVRDDESRLEVEISTLSRDAIAEDLIRSIPPQASR
jgi:hypothetical protein